MGQKAIRALILRGSKMVEARSSDRRAGLTRSKDATGRPLVRHRRALSDRHHNHEVV